MPRGLKNFLKTLDVIFCSLDFVGSIVMFLFSFFP